MQSRYYDSNIGRFINADDVTNLGVDQNLISYNLYAYCSNNPVMFTDPSGESVGILFAFLALGTVVGGIVGGIIGAQSEEDEVDIVGGIIVGSGVGLAATGLGMSFGGAMIFLATHSTTGAQAFALGALAYNVFPLLFAPFFGVSMDPIETLPASHPNVGYPQQNTHPAYK